MARTKKNEAELNRRGDFESYAPGLAGVLVAGGRSSRFGAEVPKQFATLGGRPVLSYSLDLFARLNGLRALAVVLPPGRIPRDIESELTEFEQRAPDARLLRVEGGARRQDSVAAGLIALENIVAERSSDDAGAPPVEVIVVHDAARPFAPIEVVGRAILEARAVGAAILAQAVQDTVKLADERGLIERTLDRSRIWLAQTPQAFRVEHRAPLAELLRTAREFTDEAAALEDLQVPVALVEAPASNFKVTRPEDLERAESFLMQGGRV